MSVHPQPFSPENAANEPPCGLAWHRRSHRRSTTALAPWALATSLLCDPHLQVTRWSEEAPKSRPAPCLESCLVEHGRRGITAGLPRLHPTVHVHSPSPCWTAVFLLIFKKPARWSSYRTFFALQHMYFCIPRPLLSCMNKILLGVIQSD